jgi:hypothetical protein
MDVLSVCADKMSSSKSAPGSPSASLIGIIKLVLSLGVPSEASTASSVGTMDGRSVQARSGMSGSILFPGDRAHELLA